MTRETADGLIVTELSLADWLRDAFEAERAPVRPARMATARGDTRLGVIVGGARVTFWWMLGITLLAIAQR
ncbi:MAG: hypothetical protein OHK0044_06530 [Burkholderiaceae bacterium]